MLVELNLLLLHYMKDSIFFFRSPTEFLVILYMHLCLLHLHVVTGVSYAMVYMGFMWHILLCHR
jgi:hypothetical protein